MKQKNVQVEEYQHWFLKMKKNSFNFSNFVREKLDEKILEERRAGKW